MALSVDLSLGERSISRSKISALGDFGVGRELDFVFQKSMILEQVCCGRGWISRDSGSDDVPKWLAFCKMRASSDPQYV
jgi:hypothetical protein